MRLESNYHERWYLRILRERLLLLSPEWVSDGLTECWLHGTRVEFAIDQRLEDPGCKGALRRIIFCIKLALSKALGIILRPCEDTRQYTTHLIQSNTRFLFSAVETHTDKMKKFMVASALSLIRQIVCIPTLHGTLSGPQIAHDLRSILSNDSGIYLRTDPVWATETAQRFDLWRQPTYVISVKPALARDVQQVVCALYRPLWSPSVLDLTGPTGDIFCLA